QLMKRPARQRTSAPRIEGTPEVKFDNGVRAEEISIAIAANWLQGDDLLQAKRKLDESVVIKTPQRKETIDEVAIKRVRDSN
ncbi:unnamed protein product, partial [Aphanomyces euteiches]